jgi:hypothetical protein
MSNVHKTSFGLREGDTLHDIISQGYKYFKSEIKPLDG